MPRLLLAGIAIVYLWSFPYFEGIHHANELPRIYLTQAIVEEGSFVVDSGVRRYGRTSDLSRRDGHYYSNKAPGMSLLGVPVYAAAIGLARLTGQEELPLRWLTWLLRFGAVMVPSILLLPLLWRLLDRLTGQPSAASITVATLALGSGATPYAIQFMSHHVAGLCLVSALGLAQLFDSRRALLGCGALLGAAALIEYQAVLLGFPIGLYILWRHHRPAGQPWLWLGLGLTGPALLLLGYHQACFGSPWSTGYDFAATPHFAAGHGKGLLGLEMPDRDRFLGSLIGTRVGLLTVTPALLVIPVGLGLMFRRPELRALALALLATTLGALAFVSGYIFWDTGWQIGQRYAAVATPFLLLPLAPVLAATWHRSILLPVPLGLCAASVLVVTASVLQFPHWPDPVDHPLRTLVLPLYADGFSPYSVGRSIGLPGAIALLPAIALALYLVLIQTLRLGRRALPISLASLLVAGLTLAQIYHRPAGDRAKAERAYRFIQAIWEPPRDSS